ncbi:toll/interleukin-1 receptor domain-containing protein [Dawidia soli]|uniref:ADP-ribosyl cyclase/cyclic ADP-ribose hydrolase n=1 Tax=Dawidia soli TaxID=2782352 RepID=A0AAP2GJR9_9BACT|nr:TIR domain-containing protein [Dawidia soli]MBT1688268.1 TIR domain-containing protein [Dawidia soli]
MARPKRYQYDVFISHAVEDKIPVANDLDKALRAEGLQVWYSGKELSVGDELTETIYEGLDQSRFGVVIVSPTYLRKAWALGEFFRLTQRQGKAVLPVFYDITPEELAARYPPMANLVGVPMSAGIDVVVKKLCKVIQDDAKPSKLGRLGKTRQSLYNSPVRLGTLIAALLALGIAAMYGVLLTIGQRPSAELVDKTIEHRMASLQRGVDQQWHDATRGSQGKPATSADAAFLYDSFWKTRSYYRNEYTLVTPDKEISGRRNVEMTLRHPMKELVPANAYFMSDAQVYLNGSSYIFYNTRPITYTTTASSHDGQYEVTVNYAEGIRMVYTVLQFPGSESDTKRHQVTIQALPPTETYTFVDKGGAWELHEIK